MSNLFEELQRRNVVRVGIAYLLVSWLILQFVDVIAPTLDLPDWFAKVVLVLLLIGLPIALIFSWAFELTSAGLKKTEQVDQSESITHGTGKRINKVIAGALVLAVGFIVYDKFVASPVPILSEAKAAVPSIAVLPFADFSENNDQQYFSDGISEEILNLLAKTENLRVAARTSSFAFRAGEQDIRDIGKKLDVSTVLEGSVRKAGPTIRITAQLINVEDGYHIWSESYDREFKDIFKIQDEIAASILDSLKVHLLGEAKIVVSERTVNLDAYSSYLIGKERMSLQTREDIEAARSSFEKTIEIDPDYAPARVQLARAWLLLERREFGDADKAEVDAVVVPQLEKALELAPNSAEAAGVKGLHQLRRFQYDEARKSLDRAIALNPNFALAYLWRSETFYEQEKYLDMLADKERAYMLDPMSLEISAELAYDYRSFWRPKDAERIIDRMYERHPDHPLAYRAEAVNLFGHGRNGEATLVIEKALAAHPENKMFQSWRAIGLSYLGLVDEAEMLGEDDVTYWIMINQGRMGEAKALVEKLLAEENATSYFYIARDFYLRTDKLKHQNFVNRTIKDLDQRGIPWRQQCRLYFVFDLREAGIEDGIDSIMNQCRKQTEERLKASYLCPCSWFNLVVFATLDGRTEDAVKRAKEWVEKGDSFNMLKDDLILKLWADHPEYEEILARNAEQVKRQRKIYLAGTGSELASQSP